MFSNSLTSAARFASLFAAAALTATMLAGIDGLAVSQHADVALAKARAANSQVATVSTPAARI